MSGSAVKILIFLIFMTGTYLFSAMMLNIKSNMSDTLQDYLNTSYEVEGETFNTLDLVNDYSFYSLVDNYVFIILGLFVLISSIVNYYASRNLLVLVMDVIFIIFVCQLASNLSEAVAGLPEAFQDELAFFSNYELVFDNLPLLVFGIWLLDFLIIGVLL
jgi:hypothetical protein